MFQRQGGVSRRLPRTCATWLRAQGAPADRRTCATWLRAQGAPPDLIAPVMGHADSRMVERAYGRLPTDALARRLAAATGQQRICNRQGRISRIRWTAR